MQVYFTPDTVAGTSPSGGKSLFSSQDGEGARACLAVGVGRGQDPVLVKKTTKNIFLEGEG